MVAHGDRPTASDDGRRRHLIVGTAGHVDHGKSALVRAMTGQEPDRFPEERARGLTIDLGFVWCDMDAPDTGERVRVSFVDVPGHERFVNHMVSGVVGMDLVLFVVAADEGMMPQSLEHLDILELLGVKRGIIVLSKCDLADQTSIDAILQQIQQDVQGTFLEQAAVVCTSAVSRQGLDELGHLILAEASCMPGQSVDAEQTDRSTRGAGAGITRLPVDRVFSMQGLGTVVTGTLISGHIDQETALSIYPHGLDCRVRSMQSYGEEVREACAGQRVALNLPKISTEQIRRGDVVAARGSLQATSFFNVSLRLARFTGRMIENGMRVHVLIGTAHVLGRVYPFREDEHLAQIRLEEPVAALPGDRFILRFYSPPETIGGGIILETDTQKRRMSDRRCVARLQALERGERVGEKDKDKPQHTQETEHKPVIPPELRSCATWLVDLIDEAGTSLISVNTLKEKADVGTQDAEDITARQAARFGADRIERSLRLLEKDQTLVRLDETHYTTPAVAEAVIRQVRAYFSLHDVCTLAELRDMLHTNRTSARTFFTYLDRKKITKPHEGASQRTVY